MKTSETVKTKLGYFIKCPTCSSTIHFKNNAIGKTIFCSCNNIIEIISEKDEYCENLVSGKAKVNKNLTVFNKQYKCKYSKDNLIRPLFSKIMLMEILADLFNFSIYILVENENEILFLSPQDLQEYIVIDATCKTEKLDESLILRLNCFSKKNDLWYFDDITNDRCNISWKIDIFPKQYMSFSDSGNGTLDTDSFTEIDLIKFVPGFNGDDEYKIKNLRIGESWQNKNVCELCQTVVRVK